jgi:hypothetical protein
MDGTGAAGTATTYARGDHRHPADTAKVDKAGDTMTGQLTIDAPAFGLVTNATFGVVVKNRNTGDYTTYNHGGVAMIGSERGAARFPRGNLTGNRATLALQESLATTFSASSTYAVGDYVTHEGLLYKCTTAVSTAGAWNAANWSAVAVTDEMGGGGSSYYEIEYLESTGTQYIDTGVTAGVGVRVVADMEWVSVANEDCPFGSVKVGTPYTNRFFTVGQIVGSDKYYGLGCAGSWINPKTSAVALTIGTRTSVEVSVSSSVASLSLDGVSAISETGTYSFSEQIPIYLFARNSGSNQPEHNAKIKLYSLKIYSGETLVRDYIPVRSGFDGALLDRVSGTFFTNQGTGDFLLGLDVNPPVPTDSPAFTGTPTAPTAAAGTNTTQLATTAFVQGEIRYSFASPTHSVSGTSATVACEDRAINDFTVATGITSLTITPPAAVTGRARDFFCRVTLTDSSLPTVTLSGGTIDIGSTEVAGMTQGVNLLMFTEISAGHWLASRRSAS